MWLDCEPCGNNQYNKKECNQHSSVFRQEGVAFTMSTMWSTKEMREFNERWRDKHPLYTMVRM